MNEKEEQEIKEEARRILAHREEMANKILDVLEGYTCSEARFILNKTLDELDRRATVQLRSHMERLRPYLAGQKEWKPKKEPAATGSLQ